MNFEIIYGNHTRFLTGMATPQQACLQVLEDITRKTGKVQISPFRVENLTMGKSEVIPMGEIVGLKILSNNFEGVDNEN